MTTDTSTRPPPETATEARLAALRERRAVALDEARPATGKRHRRRHAATGARIVVAGLSVSTALGLAGLMAGVDSGATVAESPAPSPSDRIVIVVRSSTGVTRTAAPPVAASNAPPVTSSQSS